MDTDLKLNVFKIRTLSVASSGRLQDQTSREWKNAIGMGMMRAVQKITLIKEKKGD